MKKYWTKSNLLRRHSVKIYAKVECWVMVFVIKKIDCVFNIIYISVLASMIAVGQWWWFHKVLRSFSLSCQGDQTHRAMAMSAETEDPFLLGFELRGPPISRGPTGSWAMSTLMVILRLVTWVLSFHFPEFLDATVLMSVCPHNAYLKILSSKYDGLGWRGP